MSQTSITMGTYDVFYHDSSTGRRLAEADLSVGHAYLETLASQGGSPGEIAVATCRSQGGVPTLYLLPGSHAWTAKEPEILRQ